jgi:hypothetical protein
MRVRMRRTQFGVVRAGAFLGYLVQGSSCAEHECEYGSGPWGPARVGEPCDAPPEIAVNAVNDACEIYRCYDGEWRVPHPSSCPLIGTGEAADGAMLCPPRCLADVDVATSSLDTYCIFVVKDADSNYISVAECEVEEGDWNVPPGNDLCVITVAAGEANFPSSCESAGLNAAFALHAREGVTIPSGYGLSVACQWAIEPAPPCPPHTLNDEDVWPTCDG